MEALEALVDRSTGEAVNVSSASSTGPSRVSTTRDGTSQRSQIQTSSHGLPLLSSPLGDNTSQWDSFHEFLDGSANELDSIYEFADLQPPAEQNHPHAIGDDRFSNSAGVLAPGILSPVSTSNPTPPKPSESVKSDEQPSSGNFSGTFDSLTVASESVKASVLPQHQRQRQREPQREPQQKPDQKHHSVNNRHYPVAFPAVNMQMFPRKPSMHHNSNPKVAYN